MSFAYFSRDGVVTPTSEAHIPLDSVAYAYGYGVYETVRVRKKHALFFDDHAARLEESARIIGIAHTFTKDRVRAALEALIGATDQDTYNAKILLIGGATAADASLYMLPSNPHFPDKRMYRDGVSVIVRHFERAFPHAKSLNMLQSYLAYRDAKAAGAYDALLVDRNGNITEGTRTNFFVMKDSTIISPPEEDILLGVTRKHVLEVALKNGFSVEHEPVRLSNIAAYDCAFLTSTSTKIVPITSADTTSLRPASAALQRLMSLYDAFHDAAE